MNDINRLFINTLTDLEKRIASRDWYEILGVSALIRKLLLDGFPLVDQVNKIYKFKIEFLIVDYDLSSGNPALSFMGDGLDPDSSPPHVKTKLVDRDEFFKTVVIVANNKKYSVRDVILFEANIMGGVHAGLPKNEREIILQQMNKIFSVLGGRVSLQELRGIGRVVLRALEPLRRKVQKIIFNVV